jgi:hypothetical protein
MVQWRLRGGGEYWQEQGQTAFRRRSISRMSVSWSSSGVCCSVDPGLVVMSRSQPEEQGTYQGTLISVSPRRHRFMLLCPESTLRGGGAGSPGMDTLAMIQHDTKPGQSVTYLLTSAGPRCRPFVGRCLILLGSIAVVHVSPFTSVDLTAR